MREMLKKVKADVILSSVVSVILGAVLLIKADTAVELVCKCIAVALMVFGALYVILFLSSHFTQTLNLIVGLILLIFGIWFWANPGVLASIIPGVIGVIILVHGISSLKIALETKNNQYDKWWSVLLAAMMTTVLGILIIVFAFRITTFAVRILGIALIYDAVSSIWIVARASKAAKAMSQEAGAIDTEGREV